MSKNKIDYSQKSYPKNRLPVGIDFSRLDVVNDQGNNKSATEEKEGKKAELISFSRTDRTVRGRKTKTKLGTFIPQNNLKSILHKERTDRSYYKVLDSLRKTGTVEKELREDFDLLRDFFPTELVTEVEDYLSNIINKITAKIISQGNKKLTPRKRRGFILAVFRSVCRRNGRRFTEELVDEVNKRFGYQRCIKLFEVCKAENQLIEWNLLAKKPERKQSDLKTFYLNLINNTSNLRNHPEIAKNQDYLKIIAITKKRLTKLTTSKEHKKNLCKLIKHQDKDFISRLIFWSMAKVIAEEKFGLKLTNPEEIPGWKSLFLIKSQSKEEIPIRSFKFIFWSEFSLRKKLDEFNFLSTEKHQ